MHESETSKNKVVTPDTGEDKPKVEITTENAPVLDAEREKIIDEELKKKIGRTGFNIVLSEMDQTDKSNVLNEMVEERVKRNHLANIPIVSLVVKPIAAAYYRTKAETKLVDTGSVEAAVRELGIEENFPSITRPGEGAKYVRERAHLALDEAGSSDKITSEESIALNKGESIDKMEQGTEEQKKVKEALATLFKDYKLADKDEERKNAIREKFDEQVSEWQKEGMFNDAKSNQGLRESKVMRFLIGGGKQNITMLDGLKDAADSIEALADTSVNEEELSAYLDKNLTLFHASMKEDVYKKRISNSVLEAVAAGGAIGGITYMALAREGRSTVRSAIGGPATITGVAAGGAAGFLRGIQQARMKISQSEIEKAASEPEADSSAEAGTEGKKAMTIGSVLKKISEYKRKATGEEKYLKNIEDKLNRKSAKSYTDELQALVDGEDKDGEIKYNYDKIADTLEDIIARNRVSSDKGIDLVKYEGGVAEERHDLTKVMQEARKILLENGKDYNEEEIEKKYQKYLNANKAASRERFKFIARRAVVDGIIGAAAGGTAGAIFTLARGHELIPGIANTEKNIGGSEKLELADDADGGYTLKLGDRELIGEGDASGIDFNNDGTLTAESEEILKAAGIEFEPNRSDSIESARANVSIREFFSPSNKESNGLAEITDRKWIAPGGHDQIIIGNTHMDGEGNIIMEVAPTRGSNVDIDNMQMVLTAGDGNIDTGIVLDVNDGVVEIPAGSPAASLFEDGEFHGGYAEAGFFNHETGEFDVYSTIGDGHADVSTISIPNSEATYINGYTFSIDGESQEVSLPDEIVATAKLEAINGLDSVKGTGETIFNEPTGDVTDLRTSAGESVEVEHFSHRGGYSDIYDSYFGEKDGVYNSGASLVRQMLGSEADDLSSQEADQLFLSKVNSGEISEGDVVEDYLKTIGNSPEALVTTRTMLGNFKMDLDGDNVDELIDTQDEINIAADILGSGDSASYDKFANDTYDAFYEKIAGGTIRFVDQSQEQYQYTTWGILGENNNVLQQLGVVGNRPTDGVGIVFTDKDGNSIYDEATVRKLWHLPDDYKIDYVADRLDCIQKTARGDFPNMSSNPTSTTTTTTTTTPPTGDNPTPGPGPEPEPTPTPEPEPGGHPTKNIDAEIENSGPGEPQVLDETKTPQTTIEQDYQPVQEAHEQVSSGNTAGSDTDHAAQQTVDHSTATQQNDATSTNNANETANERAESFNNGE